MANPTYAVVTQEVPWRRRQGRSGPEALRVGSRELLERLAGLGQGLLVPGLVALLEAEVEEFAVEADGVRHLWIGLEFFLGLRQEGFG